MKEKWIVDSSGRGRFMVIHEDGSEDGRLVADGLKHEDAALIVMAPEMRDLLLKIFNRCVDRNVSLKLINDEPDLLEEINNLFIFHQKR